jgi:hypothetical protein
MMKNTHGTSEPMEKAAPVLKTRVKRSSSPTTGTLSPGANRARAISLVAKSAARAATATLTSRTSRRQSATRPFPVRCPSPEGST